MIIKITFDPTLDPKTAKLIGLDEPYEVYATVISARESIGIIRLLTGKIMFNVGGYLDIKEAFIYIDKNFSRMACNLFHTNEEESFWLDMRVSVQEVREFPSLFRN